jgi:chromosome segregation ATPase
MNEMEILEDPQRVTRWLAEGQQMLDRVIPTLIGERDRLRQAVDATERECERLRGELGEARRDLGEAHRDLGEARRDLGALQSEIEKLRGERVVMAEAFGGAVDLLGQLQRPLNEIARRLHAGQAAPVDTSVA